MVRISIPTLPNRPPLPPSGLTLLPLREQAAHVNKFLADGDGRTLIITGAGVSVESGIRAYRGKEGSYSNPNYKPIFYNELVEDSPRGALFRKRYWARSYLGYPPVRDAQPNPTHLAVASAQALGLAPWLITQNVDNLHRKALSRVLLAAGEDPARAHLPPLPSSPMQADTLTHVPSLQKPLVHELHGTLARVHCLQHMHEHSRDRWQDALSGLNPAWAAEAADMAQTGRFPRTNPDGDVELPGADYTTFRVPDCPICEAEGKPSIVKPNVIFFGETLPAWVKNESLALVEAASRVLVLGTSLATYSAFRLIKAAREADKPVLMLSHGPSRADDVPGVEKMDVPAGPVLRAALDPYLKGEGRLKTGVRSVIDSGVVKKLPGIELPRDDGMLPTGPTKIASAK